MLSLLSIAQLGRKGEEVLDRNEIKGEAFVRSWRSKQTNPKAQLECPSRIVKSKTFKKKWIFPSFPNFEVYGARTEPCFHLHLRAPARYLTKASRGCGKTYSNFVDIFYFLLSFHSLNQPYRQPYGQPTDSYRRTEAGLMDDRFPANNKISLSSKKRFA